LGRYIFFFNFNRFCDWFSISYFSSTPIIHRMIGYKFERNNWINSTNQWRQNRIAFKKYIHNYRSYDKQNYIWYEVIFCFLFLYSCFRNKYFD
jgi:hypothetical protein